MTEYRYQNQEFARNARCGSSMHLSYWRCAVVGISCAICFSPIPSWGQFRDVTPGKAPAPQKTAAPPVTKPKASRNSSSRHQPDSTPKNIAENPTEKPPLLIEAPDSTAPLQPEAPIAESDGDRTTDDATSKSSPDDSQENSDQAPRALRINGVEAGVTRVDELKRAWGDPLKIDEEHGHEVHKYKLDPFRQVHVTLDDDKIVSAVLVFLQDPLDPDALAEEIGIKQFRPVPIPDETGRVMGQAYPERGVLMGFGPQPEDSEAERFQMEPVSPEMFVLRAEYDFQQRFQLDLEDLEMALRLDPDHAAAWWLEAEILEAVGKYQQALQAAQQAARLDSDSPRYRLTKARLVGETGKADRALRETREVLEASLLTPEVRAYAECQLGNLVSRGSAQDFKTALQHHMQAIELASPLANDPRFAVRRLAKQAMIEAHLAVALDIASGNFQRKPTTVPKWTERAKALIDDWIENEQGDETWMLRLYGTQLEAAEAMSDSANVDIRATVDLLLQDGRRLIAENQDPLQQSRVQWEMGTALLRAVHVERSKGQYQDAMRYADNALALMEQSAPQRESSPRQKHHVGQLYFVMGSLHAVHKSDHHEAVHWYDKAKPLLTDTTPFCGPHQIAVHGERFVSMGVSYWEVGDRQQAVEVTEHGAEIMRDAVKDGKIKSAALAVPYGNLATMHRHLGNESQASQFAELASRVEQRSQQ